MATRRCATLSITRMSICPLAFDRPSAAASEPNRSRSQICRNRRWLHFGRINGLEHPTWSGADVTYEAEWGETGSAACDVGDAADPVSRPSVGVFLGSGKELKAGLTLQRRSSAVCSHWLQIGGHRLPIGPIWTEPDRWSPKSSGTIGKLRPMLMGELYQRRLVYRSNTRQVVVACASNLPF